MDKVKVQHHSFTAFSWFSGWLFAVGFLNLPFFKAVLAIIIWPYYLGEFIRTLLAL